MHWKARASGMNAFDVAKNPTSLSSFEADRPTPNRAGLSSGCALTPETSTTARADGYLFRVSEFPHLQKSGAAHMVDVGAKSPTHRTAIAEAFVALSPDTLERLKRAELRKGDALSVARLAGIGAAKKAADLLPLAHPIFLSHVAVHIELAEGGVRIEARVETTGPTGVEMEALTAASVAALNLYDMVKAHERGAVIERVRLMEKRGGKTGLWRREGHPKQGGARDPDLEPTVPSADAEVDAGAKPRP